ncbi:hypothetical protein DUI87_03422 [Hirundo rustica rustica]|uniref:ribonuclease H n=1 Tax=Hirundo rustica rustica TaxID=333673 RepID=A0A3M0L429_HIRRU|nr:hypothetical protein DUI87_03422 [Hirundo rustica rustica]
MVWIRWPGTSEPQKYEALVDTGSQCTLIPSEYVGTEPISIAGVTGGSQELTLLEAEVSLTGKEWQKHPIVTGSGAPCILGIDFLRNGYYKDSKGFRWAFGIAAVEAEGIKKLNSLPGLSENPSAVGLLKVEEQRVPVATSTVHRRQYRTNRDAVIPIHKMIRELESQGVVSKTHSPFNSPIWPVRKPDGEWRLTVDYRALNEVTPPLSAAVPDMLELQYELESKAAKWYATIDIANAFFSIPLAAECRPQFAFTWRGVQYTWNRLPQGWKHSPTICHGLIQAALEKGEAPEHLQYIDDIIVWGNTAMEVFEKGEKIIHILLKAGFAIKQSKVKGPAREIQFLGVKWQDGRRQIPTEVINKITAMSPPTSKKETQAFLGAIGFWRMHIPEYSQIVSPLYLVTRKKNDFHWGPEQQQAFAQIKQEIAHAVALGPVRTGPDVKNVLYSAAGNNGLSWSLWQKVPGETRGRPLGFWSRSYRGSEANYTPTEKEILAAYEGVQAASEVIGTEAQLLLAPRLPVLGWMFKGKVPSTHHATDATWSKWIALITQRARIGNPNRPGILEIITNWPEGENFGLMDEEEQEQVTRAEEAPPYNQLPEEETRYALFTDGSCRIVGMNRKWKAAVWSPTRQVAQATEGEGGSSQLAELKAVQLALDIAEREKWPKLYLYTDSWMVANALWGWLDRWKKANWQRRGKPIWAADEWKDIATRVEKLPVKVRHVDAHVPKSRANEEHQNNEQVDQAAKIEVSKIDLDWQHKGELFLARWAHDASGHQGRDATYKWAQDRGVDLTMDSISQVIHDCETCAAIKQAKRVKPLWYGGRWSKYKYGEAWQIDYITLPQTRQGKRYVLTMVEATTGWLETYPVPHATARNTILGLEKQILWRHGTPERIESDNGTHFKNSLINTWAREHGIEWVYHIPYHAPAAGKVERCNGLLKTTLKALGAGTFKNWENNLAKATWCLFKDASSEEGCGTFTTGLDRDTPLQLRLTEGLLLKDDDWKLVSVDNGEQGNWPRVEGQIVVQIIPAWELPEDNIPTACPVHNITEAKPQVACELSVGGEAINMTGLLDTGVNVTIVPTKYWPSHWALENMAGHVQGIGGMQLAKKSKSVVQIKGPKGQLASLRPFVLDYKEPLLGRDLMAQWGVTIDIPDPSQDFWAAAAEERPTRKLNWKTDSPVWVEQWPLSKQKLKALEELMEEQLAKGHIVETTSPWNSPVFVIQKPGKDKWRLLQDLRQINNVIEDMGSLQPGMPSPTMLPQNWKLAVIDIKDCFFQIPLHPDDAPRFAFSVPTINREAPRKRYHWQVLLQGMKTSLVICQWYVASLLSPVRVTVEKAIIHHYMDDVLVCAPTDDVLSHALDLTINALVVAGFKLQEDKVQRMPPWR